MRHARYRSATCLPDSLISVNGGTENADEPGLTAVASPSRIRSQRGANRMETSMSLELDLLAELRAALSENEISSEVREDVAGLAVSTDAPGVYLWVFVSFSGRYYSWAQGNHQHPVNDKAGAARRIATHVQGLHLLGGGKEDTQ